MACPMFSGKWGATLHFYKLLFRLQLIIEIQLWVIYRHTLVDLLKHFHRKKTCVAGSNRRHFLTDSNGCRERVMVADTDDNKYSLERQSVYVALTGIVWKDFGVSVGLSVVINYIVRRFLFLYICMTIKLTHCNTYYSKITQGGWRLTQMFQHFTTGFLYFFFSVVFLPCFTDILWSWFSVTSLTFCTFFCCWYW